jgi:hypothetical protein
MTHDFANTQPCGAEHPINPANAALLTAVEEEAEFWHVTTVSLRGQSFAAEVSSTRLSWQDVAAIPNGLYMTIEAQFTGDLFAHVCLDTEGSGMPVLLPPFIGRKFKRAHCLRDDNLLEEAQGALIHWAMNTYDIENHSAMTCRSLCALERAVLGLTDNDLCFPEPSHEAYGPDDWAVTVYRKGDRYLVCVESEAKPQFNFTPFAEISVELFESIDRNPDDKAQTMLDFAEAAFLTDVFE